MAKKLIETTLPVKIIGQKSVSEMHTAHNSVKNIHQWFARRPLSASRATSYAALVNLPKTTKETDQMLLNTKRVADIETSGSGLLDIVKKDIIETYGHAPKILDPFGGSGIIPLECIRLGCDVYSNDYNPVAVMIQKCTLEYPIKYAKLQTVNGDENNMITSDKLIPDILKLTKQVQDAVDKKMRKYYKTTDTGYIWSRTITCQNPKCKADIPLIPSFKLSDKGVYLIPNVHKNKMEFSLAGPGYEEMPIDFDLNSHTIKATISKCFVCGHVLNNRETHDAIRNEPHRDTLLVIAHMENRIKKFRLPTHSDKKIFQECEEQVKKRRTTFKKKYSIDPIPDELIGTPTGVECKQGGDPYWVLFGTTTTGQTHWGHLFNPRQKLFMISMLEELRNLEQEMFSKNTDKEYIKCLMAYMGLILDRFVGTNSKTAQWRFDTPSTTNSITGTAMKLRWIYGEINPLFSAYNFPKKANIVINGIKFALTTFGNKPATITNTTATELPYPSKYFDAIFTDPPYYDLKAYADLSDFYYVWLKRSIGHLFPEYFNSNLSPKANEIIVNDTLVRNNKKDDNRVNLKTKQYYEKSMADSFNEIKRILKDDGIMVIVFSHTKLESWETLINSIGLSGLRITAAWPINTENENRPSARKTASLQSTIYMVARKIKKEKKGIYVNVQDELQIILEELDNIEDCISNEDYLIAATGFGLKIITKYETIENHSGDKIETNEILQYIREIAVDHIMQKLTGGNLQSFGDIAMLYVMWRHMYGRKSVKYDLARVLCLGCGIDMNEYVNILYKKDGKVTLLDHMHFTEDHKIDPDKMSENNMINVMHKALVLMKHERHAEVFDILHKHDLYPNKSFNDYIKIVVNFSSGGTNSEIQDMKTLYGILDKSETLDS